MNNLWAQGINTEQSTHSVDSVAAPGPGPPARPAPEK